MTYVFLLMIGVVVGLIGASMGIGGGLLIVPIFLHVMGFSVQQTVGTAMVIVFFNAASATAAYMRQGCIHYGTVWRFGLMAIPGAMLGSWLSDYVGGALFEIIFGLFLLVVAFNMLRRRGTDPELTATDITVSLTRGRKAMGMAVSGIVGVISTVLGIGGGIVYVPFMSQVEHFPIRLAIGTSSGILLVSSAAGLAAHGVLGHVLWIEAIVTGIGAFLGAQSGARITQRLAPGNLRAAFSLLVFSIGVKFLFEGLG